MLPKKQLLIDALDHYAAYCAKRAQATKRPDYQTYWLETGEQATALAKQVREDKASSRLVY